MEREIPAWLVALLVFFGLTTVASFSLVVFFHARSAAYFEEWKLQDQRHADLIDLEEQLEQRYKNLAQPIKDRSEKIRSIEAKEAELKSDVRDTLLPDLANTFAEGERAIGEQREKFGNALDRVVTERTNLAREEETHLIHVRQADEERAKHRADVEKLSREVEALKRKHRQEIKVLDDVIDERESRVAELIDRTDTDKTTLHSDGVILQATATAGFVVIDRGLDDNLRRGTVFKVFNRRGGDNYIKGEIEVWQVKRRTSVCRVLDEADANDPLIPGDHIFNAIYNPDEQKIFVIVGEFQTYSHGELQRFIEDVGGRVDDELSIDTHYLVAGENSDEALEKASRLGVIILNEDKLIEFVRPATSFQVGQGMTYHLVGDFDRVPRSRVRRFVVANGGVIADSLHKDVHFVIAGDGATDAMIRARALGIPVITQDRLIHLTGSTRDRQ